MIAAVRESEFFDSPCNWHFARAGEAPREWVSAHEKQLEDDYSEAEIVIVRRPNNPLKWEALKFRWVNSGLPTSQRNRRDGVLIWKLSQPIKLTVASSATMIEPWLTSPITQLCSCTTANALAMFAATRTRNRKSARGNS